MGRRALSVIGLLVGVLAGAAFLNAQPFPTPVAQAIALLTSGTTPFSIVGIDANGYINFGTDRSDSGYGIRDAGGVIQAKNSGGSWSNLSTSGGAPSTATYITQVPDGALSAEQALSTLASAILVNTTTTGVLSAYAGTSCTNQFVSALSGLGVATCASVDVTADITGVIPVANGGTNISSYAVGDLLQATGATTLSKLAAVATGNVLISGGVTTASSWGKVGLTTHVSGTLPVANGGTGLTSGTSGGVLAYTASGTLASSGALTANQLVLGGGAGVAPSALGSLGTTTTVLHGNAAGAPSFAAVDIAADTTGTLTVARGGTNIASYAVGDLLYASGATTLSKLADVTAGSYLRSGGVTTAPVWSTTTLPNAATTGDLMYAWGWNSYANWSDVAAGSFLRSGGVASVRVWSTTTWTNAATTGDLIYASGRNVVGNLADVATGRVLISGGVGVAPSWSVDAVLSTVTGTSATMSSYVKVTETTFALRPASPAVGMIVNFSDANTTTWGANVTTGGGSNHIQARYNGAQWTVVGK